MTTQFPVTDAAAEASLAAIETSVAAAATQTGQGAILTELDAIGAIVATAGNQTAGNTILSAIVSALAGVLSVYTKNMQVTGNLTVADPTGVAAGSAVTINTDG